MNRSASLLERAAEIYDFSSGLRVVPGAPQPIDPIAEPVIAPVSAAPAARLAPNVVEAPAAPSSAPAEGPSAILARGPRLSIDRTRLAAHGLLVPERPSSKLAEEFRLVKRQLIAATAADRGAQARCVLVASAHAGDGKTFCALNLALSLAAERDREVLLVDGDVIKPGVFETLGLDDQPGLIDALADPSLDPAALICPTDIPGLSLMASGRRADEAPELLGSDRARDLLAALAADPRRIVLIDSPPILAASPAPLLAGHVGRVLVVVRADRTNEADLREAVGLLSACDHVNLILNGAAFATGGRRSSRTDGYAHAD